MPGYPLIVTCSIIWKKSDQEYGLCMPMNPKEMDGESFCSTGTVWNQNFGRTAISFAFYNFPWHFSIFLIIRRGNVSLILKRFAARKPLGNQCFWSFRTPAMTNHVLSANFAAWNKHCVNEYSKSCTSDVLAPQEFCGPTTLWNQSVFAIVFIVGTIFNPCIWNKYANRQVV